MGLDQMGKMNVHWGICGFTSALYALYHHSPSQHQARLSGGAATPTRMLAEIKTYLRMLQADGQTGLLDDIRDFTRSFGNEFKTFTIESYIQRINDAVQQSNVTSDKLFSIAMPPHAVADYLKRVCGFQNPQVVDASTNAAEAIVGVFKSAAPGTKYGGLKHYLYRNNSAVYSGTDHIYSWGSRFASEAAAGYDRISQKIIF